MSATSCVAGRINDHRSTRITEKSTARAQGIGEEGMASARTEPEFPETPHEVNLIARRGIDAAVEVHRHLGAACSPPLFLCLPLFPLRPSRPCGPLPVFSTPPEHLATTRQSRHLFRIARSRNHRDDLLRVTENRRSREGSDCSSRFRGRSLGAVGRRAGLCVKIFGGTAGRCPRRRFCSLDGRELQALT